MEPRHLLHNGVEIIAGQIVPAPSMRPGRSAADEAAEGKAGHNKGLRQFSRQVRRPPSPTGRRRRPPQTPSPRRPLQQQAPRPQRGLRRRARAHARRPRPLPAPRRLTVHRRARPPAPPRPAQVWMKVMEKQKTNYNEVADELVQEFREEAAQVRRPRSLRALGRADLERSPSPSPRPP